MQKITIEKLNEAIEKLAKLIDQTGEDLWPIVERLEAERDKILSREERLRRYLGRQENLES
tara:strand:+ start:579 stop:761 length:183 start_codon:yes stop_codon:yes gene_type:complete